MCRRATCRVCGKTTWAGCGQHVDQVMQGVPGSDRCPGHADSPKGDRAPASSGPSRPLLSRLFGRG
ncbi:hypothetical protein [Janibacter sp. GS2]|uniref:hypothetical protein n=1 Tax=Janibacter sp. GS2 TaxID=3442646 RepID=UPI003EBCEEEE